MPPARHAERSEMVRQFLRRQHLQAWIAWRPEELVMLAGYLPFWGASVLLFLESGPPVLFLPALEPRDRIPTELEVRQYPWGILGCTDPYKVLVAEIQAEINRRGVDKSRVGMLRDSSRSALPIQAAEQIPLPGLFWETFSGVAGAPDASMEHEFLQLYLRKTDSELAAIRLANQGAAVGIQIFHDQLKPAIREIDLATAIESAIQKQIGHNGIFYARAWAMVQSGPNSADAGRFNRSSARELQTGDLVLLELATCVNGYWSDLTRTAPVGQLKPELAKIFTTVVQSQQAAIRAVRPGVTAGQIDAIARDTIAEAGFSAYFTHATGHHVGFRYHDPGFALCPGASEKLEPGMVITIEPGIYAHALGGGVRMEDNVLVTGHGFDVLSQTATRATV